VPVRVSPAAGPGESLPLRGTAHWLVCKEECIPESQEVALDLPIAAGVAEDAADADRVRAALAAVPAELPGWTAAIAAQDAATLTLRAELAPGAEAQRRQWFFYPATGGIIEPAEDQPAVIDENAVTLRLTKSATLEDPVTDLRGVLVGRSRDVRSPAIAVVVAAAPASAPPTERGSPWTAVLLAFAGGVLLNLMPCVFPVLAVKVLGFAGAAAKGRRHAATHSLAYSAGILVSFWALAAVLLALRAGDAHLGWGFQLQSPPFVLAMAFVMSALALSLLGVFEIGSGWISRISLPSGAEGHGRSFASGVLATAIATPCTAPFMGTALGYALVAPAAAALAVFTALALGMAAPYVALSLSPGLIRALPRPGPWMETLKQVLAFPLLATVVWLLWVYGRQSGPEAQTVALAGLLAAAFGLWVLGRFAGPAAAAGPRRLAAAVALAAIAGGFLLALPPRDAPAGGARAASIEEPGWEPYSAARLAELRAAGTPVFVDFTAAWCLTCQVNKRVAFSSERVAGAFADLGVVALRADWTDRDPEITRALASFGRSGVPLNVVYGIDPSREPIVLPTVLTPSIVLDAIEAACGVPPATAEDTKS
jgi:thiol:disulfide interchange protein DsbD